MIYYYYYLITIITVTITIITHITIILLLLLLLFFLNYYYRTIFTIIITISITMVEASANDLYWGSGLPFNITVTTTPDKYPGKNMIGKLLCDIRSELRANDIISVNPTPASQGTAVTVPSHKFLETPIHA